jgi:exopolysaccharide biosynthesis glucuronosyltransferase PssE
VIFVTVGVQLPFDRLIRAVDQWAGGHPGQQVFAQIGVSALSPKNLRFEQFLEPDQFSEQCQQADLIIGHAGMGSILTALEFGKPLLIMPRRAALGEHRNDHQLATVERFSSLANVHAAKDEIELAARLGDLGSILQTQCEGGSTQASPQLIQTLKDFIQQG